MENRFNEVVLMAGHGGSDSGACRSDGLCERDTTKKIVNSIESWLRSAQIPVTVLDRNNDLDLAASIALINSKIGHYDTERKDNVLALEIHQDGNYPNLQKDKLNKQRGVYYYQDDEYSKSVANLFVQSFIDDGSYNATAYDRTDFDGSWSKGHYLPWAGYRLGWIEQTNPFAQLFECGYIAGENTDAQLEEHGYIAARAIAKLFGKTVQRNTTTSNPPIIQTPIIKVTPAEIIKEKEIQKDIVKENTTSMQETVTVTKTKETINIYDFVLGMFKNGTIEHYLNSILLTPTAFLMLSQLNVLSKEGNIAATAAVWFIGSAHALLKMNQATQIKVAKLNNPI